MPFPASNIQSRRCFVLIHVDLWGPYKIVILDGNKYFLTVLDDYSRMTWVFLLKQKSNACVSLQHFFSFFRTQFDTTVKVIRLENETEFVNSVWKFIKKNGCHTPENLCIYPSVKVERKHKHILEVTRAIRFQAQILLKFWGHCILAAVYMINRMSRPVISNMSPLRGYTKENLPWYILKY